MNEENIEEGEGRRGVIDKEKVDEARMTKKIKFTSPMAALPRRSIRETVERLLRN